MRCVLNSSDDDFNNLNDGDKNHHDSKKNMKLSLANKKCIYGVSAKVILGHI